MEHAVTKTELIFEQVDTPEFFYSIGFHTPALDDRGLTHILEHCVLAGSKNFPAKDPFVQLLKSAHHTFLNALTFPEFTVYPVGSTNEKSFKKLMHVYTDAVFNPLVKENKGIFLQEGWRYEKEKGKYKLSGVVFNEMQGALANHESYAEDAFLQALFPHTSLANQSGGDPREIMNLKYDDLVEYHDTYYHPSNARIFIRGSIADIEYYLDFLDTEYISQYEKSTKHHSLKKADKVTNDKYIQKVYAPDSDTYSVGKAWGAHGYSVKQDMERNLIGYILGDAKDGLLHNYLLDSGKFESLNFYHEADIACGSFMLHAVAKKKAISQKKTWQMINEFFADQDNYKLDSDKFERRVRNFAFQYYAYLDQEDGFGRMRSIYPRWMAGDDVAAYFQEGQVINELVQDMTPSKFARLVKKYLVDNSHYAQVAVVPGADAKYSFSEHIRKREEKINASPADTKKLIDQDIKIYNTYKNQKDDKDTLALFDPIPVRDLASRSTRIAHTTQTRANTKYITAEDESNLGYLCLSYDLSKVRPEDILLLDLWASMVPKIELENGDKLSDYISSYTSELETTYSKQGKGKQVLLMQFGYLKTFKKEAESLIQRILTEGTISTKQAHQEITKQVADKKQALVTRGNYYSALRSSAYRDRLAWLEDQVEGVGSVEYMTAYKDVLAQAISGLKEPLADIPLSHVATNTKLGDTSFPGVGGHSKKHATLSESLPRFSTLKENTKHEHVNNKITVNYNALAWRVNKVQLMNPAFRVLQAVISLDYLWREIRERGGAYGAGIGERDGALIHMSSYRDSQTKRTFKVFYDTQKYLENTVWTKDFDITRYIVRSFSTLDRPMSIQEKIIVCLYRDLRELTQSDLDAFRKEMKHLDTKILKREAKKMFANMSTSTQVTIGAGEEGKKYQKITEI